MSGLDGRGGSCGKLSFTTAAWMLRFYDLTAVA